MINKIIIEQHMNLAKVSAHGRNLGFIPLNNWFPNSHGHHVDKNYVIFIPIYLHVGEVNRKYTNIKAFKFLFDQLGIIEFEKLIKKFNFKPMQFNISLDNIPFITDYQMLFL